MRCDCVLQPAASQREMFSTRLAPEHERRVWYAHCGGLQEAASATASDVVLPEGRMTATAERAATTKAEMKTYDTILGRSARLGIYRHTQGEYKMFLLRRAHNIAGFSRRKREAEEDVGGAHIALRRTAHW